MNGKEQARLLGLLLWILTGLHLLIIGFIGVIYFFVFGAMMVSAPHGADGPPPALFAGILVVVMIVLGVMTALFAIPKLVAGYGLRKEKSWAKIWAIIACIMACTTGLLGIAVGVYGLVFIFGDAGKAYFDNPNYGRFQPSSGMPPPPPNSWQ
jgi:hypothetical protein